MCITRANLDGSGSELCGHHGRSSADTDRRWRCRQDLLPHPESRIGKHRGRIWSKDLTSGTTNLLYSVPTFAGGLALDAEHGKLYFGEPAGYHSVRRMNTDGSGVEIVINNIYLGT